MNTNIYIYIKKRNSKNKKTCLHTRAHTYKQTQTQTLAQQTHTLECYVFAEMPSLVSPHIPHSQTLLKFACTSCHEEFVSVCHRAGAQSGGNEGAADDVLRCAMHGGLRRARPD